MQRRLCFYYTEVTDWTVCFICQEDGLKNPLECPATNSKRADKTSGYNYLAEQLLKFNEIGHLPTDLAERVKSSCNTELSKEELSNVLIKNSATFHKVCKNRYDKLRFDRACKKRKEPEDATAIDFTTPPGTRRRYSADNFQQKCFFYDKPDTEGNLTKAQTLGLDTRARNATEQLCDEQLLVKLSQGISYIHRFFVIPKFHLSLIILSCPSNLSLNLFLNYS